MEKAKYSDVPESSENSGETGTVQLYHYSQGTCTRLYCYFFFTKCFVSTIYIISAANKKRKVEIAIYLENSSHSSGAYSTRNDTRECLSSVYYPCATALLFRENVRRKCSRASLLQRNILLKLSLMSLLKNA